MKTKILVLMCGLLFISSYLFAGDGDLIVNGNVGIGTTYPTAKLDVDGGARINSNGGIQLLLSSTATTGQYVQIAYSKGGTWKWMMGTDGASDAWTML